MGKSQRQDYLAISDVLLTTAMLTNDLNDQVVEDEKKIVDFIGEVYKLSEETKKRYTDLISDDLTVLSTKGDVEAYLSNDGLEVYPEIGKYLYLKSEALIKIENIYNLFVKSPFTSSYFKYDHIRPYFPDIRFEELEVSSTKGDIDINRTVAILLSIGIGCEVNLESAIYRFRQCALWGDISSFYYLAYLYDKKGDKESAKTYSELIELIPTLYEGRTLIPEEDKPKYKKETVELFNLISAIKQDIILAHRIYDIDFSFVEVLFLDKIDYFTKMGYVNDYGSFAWKEVTNPSANPSKKLGFTLKGDK